MDRATRAASSLFYYFQVAHITHACCCLRVRTPHRWFPTATPAAHTYTHYYLSLPRTRAAPVQPVHNGSLVLRTAFGCYMVHYSGPRARGRRRAAGIARATATDFGGLADTRWRLVAFRAVQQRTAFSAFFSFGYLVRYLAL